jgi:hypothetical protein
VGIVNHTINNCGEMLRNLGYQDSIGQLIRSQVNLATRPYLHGWHPLKPLSQDVIMKDIAVIAVSG